MSLPRAHSRCTGRSKCHDPLKSGLDRVPARVYLFFTGNRRRMVARSRQKPQARWTQVEESPGSTGQTPLTPGRCGASPCDGQCQQKANRLGAFNPCLARVKGGVRSPPRHRNDGAPVNPVGASNSGEDGPVATTRNGESLRVSTAGRRWSVRVTASRGMTIGLPLTGRADKPSTGPGDSPQL